MTTLDKLRAFAETRGPGGFKIGIIEAREIASDFEWLRAEVAAGRESLAEVAALLSEPEWEVQHLRAQRDDLQARNSELVEQRRALAARLGDTPSGG